MNQYNDFYRLEHIYNSISDKLSKKIFLSRLKYDLEPTLENALEFYSIADPYYDDRLNRIKKVANSGKEIYFYGAGYYGIECYNILNIINKNSKFKGFFDVNYKDIKTIYSSFDKYNKKPIINGFSDKHGIKCNINADAPVYAPPTKEWVKSKKEADYVIFITSRDYIKEIRSYLNNLGINNENIEEFCSKDNIDYTHNQYFEFMDCYKTKGIFIDAGCYDGNTSVLFAKLCKEKYTKIYAFEPNTKNVGLCKKNKEFMSLNNAYIISAGLGSTENTSYFSDNYGGSSCISDNGDTEIRITTIDW